MVSFLTCIGFDNILYFTSHTSLVEQVDVSFRHDSTFSSDCFF